MQQYIQRSFQEMKSTQVRQECYPNVRVVKIFLTVNADFLFRCINTFSDRTKIMYAEWMSVTASFMNWKSLIIFTLQKTRKVPKHAIETFILTKSFVKYTILCFFPYLTFAAYLERDASVVLLEILEADLQVKLTCTSDDVLTTLLNHTLDGKAKNKREN